ncbi:hypothetical protein LPJ61_003931 [Coemansia biformis]|uniref:RRM domain-containing protein n=1 Tax=Coemansia biformis TaxID=1286918 RepID=A0A9W7YAA5_9FUNG|nr:hypothetical protein LPJ61_003931 [Coemansia biformis]
MGDEITTIFVVGFPDDMREREFQNMFTFSPGFEAATLKVPAADDIDKDSQRKQIIGFAKFNSRVEALEARDVLTGRRVDAEKNCVLKAELAKKNLHTRRGLSSIGPSSATALTFGLDTPTTALSSQPQQQQPQQPQQQPQQQQLQHQQQMPVQHPFSSQAPIQQGQSAAQQYAPGLGMPQGLPRTASLTNTMLASANRPEHLRISAARAFNPFSDAPLASAPILGAGAHRNFSSSQYSAFSSGADTPGAAAPVHHVPGTAGVMGSFAQPAISSAGAHSGMFLGRRGSIHGSTPASSSLARAASGAQQPQPQQPQHHIESSSSDSDAQPQYSQAQAHLSPIAQPKGLAGQRPAVLDIASLQPRLGQLSLGQLSANSLISPMGMPYSASVSSPMGMVLPMATTRSVNSNDQNPPCNTLYVGNLPVGAKEDELRQVFQGALGYRRMSYKAKPNSGPMCFVEFESIDFATLAMSDLDGRMLSNSVGGGIRLSYSKNPLGVRSHNNPTSVAGVGVSVGAGASVGIGSTMLTSAAVAAAAAAMANGYHPANGSPYGYPAVSQQQLQHQQQLQQHQQLHLAHRASPALGMPASLRQAATPSPPGAGLSTRNAAMAGQGAAAANSHRSISSSSHVSPIPSPGATKGGDEQDGLPRDALSFLHQPIHRLHKQAANDPACSCGPDTPPQTGAAAHVTDIALEQ